MEASHTSRSQKYMERMECGSERDEDEEGCICMCLPTLLFHRKNEFIECGLKLLVFFAAAGAISAF